MSDTPRTDAREFAAIELKPSRVVYASFARQLETELAETRAEIERKGKLIEQMRVALKLALLFIPENAVDAIRLSKAALSAAERGEK